MTVNGRPQEHEVEPPPELEPHLVEVRDALEAQSFVHPNRRRVVGVNASDHDVFANRGAFPHERLDER